MGRALGISTAALRLQNVYGPGQSLRNPYTGIISIFSNQMRQNLPVNIYEDGNESRDFVYVDDVADVFMSALHFKESRVLVNVGDQWSDLDGGHSIASYKLPNPIYLIP